MINTWNVILDNTTQYNVVLQNEENMDHCDRDFEKELWLILCSHLKGHKASHSLGRKHP